MPEGLAEELHEVRPRAGGGAALPHRDVRARRPPFFGSILRLDLARRLTRVATLAVLDAAGIYLALLTALELKLIVRGESDIAAAWEVGGCVGGIRCLTNGWGCHMQEGITGGTVYGLSSSPAMISCWISVVPS